MILTCGRCGDEIDPETAIRMWQDWACSESCAHDIEQAAQEWDQTAREWGQG